MISLQQLLPQIEHKLNAKGAYIYKKLGIRQAVYSSWRRGKVKRPHDNVYRKFKSEFGIDLFLSQAIDEVVIVNQKKFEALIQSKPAPRPKENRKSKYEGLVVSLEKLLPQIENLLGVDGPYVYTKLGIGQTMYNALKTGKRKFPRDSVYAKFKTEFGIDLYLSQKKGVVVLSNKSLFLKQCKKREPSAFS